MTQDEQKYVKDVLDYFYPNNPAGFVNDALAEFAARILHAALVASEAMDLVPRPPGGPPGMVWLLSQAVMAFWRSEVRKQRIYETIRSKVALNHRSEYAILKSGDE